MPKFTELRDTHYALGMNDIDDLLLLKDGEVAELVNLVPSAPLEVRKGCECFEKQYYYYYDKVFTFQYQGKLYEKRFRWYKNPGNEYFILLDVDIGNSPYCRDVREVHYAQVGNFVYITTPYGAWQVRLTVCGGWYTFLSRDIPQSDTLPIPVPAISYDEGGERNKFAYRYVFTLAVIEDGVCVYETPHVAVPSFRRSWGLACSLMFDQYDTSTPRKLSVGLGSCFSGIDDSNNPAEHNLTDWQISRFGFTHVRIYRTRNFYDEVKTEWDKSPYQWSNHFEEVNHINNICERVIKDATLYYLADTPLLWSFDDTIVDDDVLFRRPILKSGLYDALPANGALCYHKNRLFAADDIGNIYFSELPALDGTELVPNVAEVNKYAMWFKPFEYRIDIRRHCDDRVNAIVGFGEDLFIFSNKRIYMIKNGDPTVAPEVCICERTGCRYPDSITPLVMQGQGGLFFQDAAPYVLTSDGVQEFEQFKIKALWGKHNGELGRAVSNAYCSAIFFDNVLYVCYKVGDNAGKTFAYKFGSDGQGAYEIRLPFEIRKFIVSRLTLPYCNRGADLRDVPHLEFDGDGYFGCLCDSFSPHDTKMNIDRAIVGWGTGSPVYEDMPIEFSLCSRKLCLQYNKHKYSELFAAIACCDFEFKEREGRRFVYKVFNNRFEVDFNYYDNMNHNYTHNSVMPVHVLDLRRSVDFCVPAGFMGEYFQYRFDGILGEEDYFKLYDLLLEVLPRPQFAVENIAIPGEMMFFEGRPITLVR